MNPGKTQTPTSTPDLQQEKDHERTHWWRTARTRPRQRRREVRLRAALPGDRSAAGRARCQRHPLRDDPARGCGRAHGRRPLQDDGQGRCRARQPGPGHSEPRARPADGPPRGRAGARDHVAAPCRRGVSVDARDFPGTGPARSHQAGREVEWSGVRVDPDSGARAHGLPRDVGRTPGPGAPRDSRPRALRDWRPGDGADPSGRERSLLAATAVRRTARGGRGAAREREDAGDLRRHRRRSCPGERRTASGSPNCSGVR